MDQSTPGGQKACGGSEPAPLIRKPFQIRVGLPTGPETYTGAYPRQNGSRMLPLHFVYQLLEADLYELQGAAQHGMALLRVSPL